MTKTQRTIYFVCVCAGILAVGLLILAYGYKEAHAATTQGFCTVSGRILTCDTSAFGTQPGGSFEAQTYIGNYPDTSDLYGEGTCSGSGCTIDNPSTFDTTGQPTDNYWINITQGANTQYYVYTITGGGDVVTPGEGSDATSITITQPTQGTSTPSTTLDISANYNIGTDLASFSTNGSLPSQIGIKLVLQNTANGLQTDLGTDYNISTSTGSYTYATSTVAAQATYTLIASLVGDYGFVPPPDNCTPILPFQTCQGSGNIATRATSLPPVTFSLDNGPTEILGFNAALPGSRNGLATTTCSITAIGGCFQNALAFLFYPSPDILYQFQFLWSLIQKKPPFGYVSTTIGALQGINASSTPAFQLPTNLPLMDTIFTPLRTGVSALLWLLFAIAFYRGRLRHLDI